jgi:general nucleoside transport system ATP-binding protein
LAEAPVRTPAPEGAAAPATPSAIRCEEVSVSFGDVRALVDVTLAFSPGAVHAIVGQNGAGKTTIARALSGLIVPDTGRTWIGEHETTGIGVRGVRVHGLEMVHQHLALPPSFTVAESLELFSTRPRRLPFFRRSEIEQEWVQQVRRMGLSIPLRTRVQDLPIEAAQALEIARALSSNVHILILDEPTAVLPPEGIDRLFERVRNLRDDGLTVLLVLHKLKEVRRIADTVTVLRDGRVEVTCVPIGQIGDDVIARHIVGSSTRAALARQAREPEPEIDVEASGRVLELTDISTEASSRDPALGGVSLRIAAGEIVGVAGVEGNGQRPLVSAIAGLERLASGRIAMGGVDVSTWSPAQRRAAGLRTVPFDRQLEGLAQSTSLWRNVGILAVVLRRLTRGPFTLVHAIRAEARAALEKWGVRFHHIDQEARELSGGNAQRLVFSRELSDHVQLLLAAQPTRGLDVAATEFVHATLRELRELGAGVLLVSSDLDELMELSDRIVVLLGGEIVADFARPFDLERIGAAMVGAS